MMTIRAALTAAALIVPLTAQAQTVQWTVPQPTQEFGQAYGSEQLLRVQVSFRAPLQAMPAEIDADVTMLERARKALYAQAQRECTVLSEAFNKAECRLGNLLINLNSFVAANNPQPPQLTAIATFLLKLK